MEEERGRERAIGAKILRNYESKERIGRKDIFPAHL